MESNDSRLIAVVNLFADALFPKPDDPDPPGPWGPWIREALHGTSDPEPWKQNPLPDPWSRSANWAAALVQLASLAGQVDDHSNPFGGRQPRPNWALAALQQNLAYLNPQPLPPSQSPIGFAWNLAHVALRHAREAGREEGSRMLLQFANDYCGNDPRFLLPKWRVPPWWWPFPRDPNDPDGPRPPRPEESLVLGATLIRASAAADMAVIRQAGEQAGQQIFKSGLSALQ